MDARLDMDTMDSPNTVASKRHPHGLQVGSPPTNGSVRNYTQAEPTLGTMVLDSVHEPWWSSFRRQLGEALRNEKLPQPPRYRPAAKGEDDIGPLLLESVHEPWYHSVVRQTRDLFREGKQRPLKLTSKPVPVKSIWGSFDFKREGLSTSAIAHVLVVVLAFTVFGGPTMPKDNNSVDLVIPVDISPYLSQILIKPKAPAGESGGGGGGGQRSPLPASKGKLPRFSMEQLTPPTPIIKNENPKLAVEPTVIVPPSVEVAAIDMNIFGDPLGQIGPPSAGPGSGGGIGSGKGTGVGSGRGPGVGPGSGGGIGGGVFRVGGGVSAPRLTYKVEPEYSEEARKAKYQGTVVLAVEVWPDGKAHNVRVLRSLGLGLDEKAIQAVEKWKFVPGKKEGRSVKVAATIEVNFRLL